MRAVETKASKTGTFRTSWALFLGSIALFSFNLEFPAKQNFDEFHYIPSAKQFLALAQNQNYEHPPLGKELIAIGVGLLGDHPLGWRIMSVLFGALTLVGIYRLALAVFGTSRAALVTALLTLFNSMLYVQARIAMLDTFMAAFLVWGAALSLEGWREAGATGKCLRLRWGGALLGLAVATKWFAVMPLAALWGFGLVHLRRKNTPSPKQLIVAWGLAPVAAYYAAFLPFLWVTKNDGTGYGLFEILFTMQWNMWDGQLRVTSPHSYGSQWWQWPLMLRPMWYAFDREGPQPEQFVRGVALIGNPVILWGGLAALLWTARDWFRSRRPAALAIVAAWSVCTFSWMLIPRKLAFFYYYYPAALCLGFAWAYCIEHAFTPRQRGLAVGTVGALTVAMFIYFFPILAALPIAPEGFMKWMWLRSWI